MLQDIVKNKVNLIIKLNLDLMHYECSAYSGEGISEIFNGLTKQILSKIESGIVDPASVMASGFKSIKIEDDKKNLTSNKKESCKAC